MRLKRSEGRLARFNDSSTSRRGIGRQRDGGRRGFNQIIKDLDSTFASTLVLIMLKLLVVLSLSIGWSIFTYDITTAFLHALLDPNDDPIFVWPPVEYFP